MEIVAHGLWAAAAAITAKRSTKASVHVGWAVWWAAFPDVLAFGPAFAAGLWLRLSGAPNAGSADGHLLPHVHVGVSPYPAGRILIVFLLVVRRVAILTRRIVFEMLGWLLHILIDSPTQSLRYYATRFLWPVSDYRIDGIAWWTPWFWAAKYAALVLVYFVLWKKRWLWRVPPSPESNEV